MGDFSRTRYDVKRAIAQRLSPISAILCRPATSTDGIPWTPISWSVLDLISVPTKLFKYLLDSQNR